VTRLTQEVISARALSMAELQSLSSWFLPNSCVDRRVFLGRGAALAALQSFVSTHVWQLQLKQERSRVGSRNSKDLVYRNVQTQLPCKSGDQPLGLRMKMSEFNTHSDRTEAVANDSNRQVQTCIGFKSDL
jgi:hypothetical protein